MLLKVLHGKKHWLFHRFTTIVLFPLILWIIYSLSLIPEITHENMVLWTSKTPNYIFLSILIIVSARHFQLGLQVILEDYISTIKFRDFLTAFIINSISSSPIVKAGPKQIISLYSPVPPG